MLIRGPVCRAPRRQTFLGRPQSLPLL